MRSSVIVLIFCGQCVAAAPFAVNTNGHADPNAFRVTTFASGLFYPSSMQSLSDGSMLVGSSVPNAGGNYFDSTGQLVRLVDANADGVADGAPQVLASGLPGGITSVRRAGNLVFATSSVAQSITVLRTGATPADPLTNIGSIQFTFPSNHEHTTYGLAIRQTSPTTSELYFNLGSRFNATNDSEPVVASGLITGNLAPESIYRATITDNGSSASAAGVQQIARGLRNSVGMAFAPNGDFYLADNGIDGSPDPNEPLSADELNRISAGNIGGAVDDFGFAGTYQQYRTGTQVGSSGILPLVAFQPIPSPNGSESEGPNEITFAPANFPSGLNGGLLVGFHGKFNFGGVTNEENPLVYVDPNTGEYFHFISNDLTNIGHPDGLFATADSLFVSDLSDGTMFSTAATGSIYQITYLPEPSLLAIAGIVLPLLSRRKRI